MPIIINIFSNMVRNMFSNIKMTKLHLAFLFLFILFWLSPAYAEKISQKPLLRPNSDMHTSAITDAAVDNNERFLVTVSQDKTAKVWSLPTGALLHTLRVPINSAEGELYGVAFAPSGQWVAAGGFSAGDEEHSIYLFNPANGQLLRRLGGLAYGIAEICISDDGSLLAAVTDGGVKVWRTKNWQVAWQDKRKTELTACDFSVDNRLLTLSVKADLRLYSSKGKLQKKQHIDTKKEPESITFNPDDSLVAVGFDNHRSIAVYDGKTLAKRYNATADTIASDFLVSPAWSQDGQYLYAANGFIDNGDHTTAVIRWSQAGRGQATRLPGSHETITKIILLKDGGVVAAAGDPAWLRLSAGGQVKQRQYSQNIDTRGKLGEHFLLSADGQQLAFGLAHGGKQPVSFSVAQRRLQPLTATTLQTLKTQQGLNAPDTKSLTITNWQDKENPTLNGKQLELLELEISSSLAVAPDHDSFLLGTMWSLYRFTAQGKKVWEKDSLDYVWGVNLSADGKLAVATLYDGTIRWYRYSDGQELLALRIDKQTQEWVLWTPSGYYDASANGDKLIGWHLNNGADKSPDFYPAKTLRKKFYRPQVINHILTTLDEAKAVRIANELGEKTDSRQTVENALPPTVKILSHYNGNHFEQQSVNLQISISRGKQAKLKLLLDGEPLLPKQPLPTINQQGKATIPLSLPKRDVTVTVIAENHLGASPPTSVRLKWAGKTPVTSGGGEFTIKPKLYILAVGVSNYHHSRLNLDFPNKDAQDFVKVLKAQQGKLYRQVESKLLTDADKDDILDGLDWLRENATAKDVTMLFLSGHGANDRDNNYRFVAADSDVQKLYRTGVSYNDIKNTLVNLAGKRLAFIDTCHSGNVLGSKTKGLAQIADINGIVNDLTAAENGVVVFASSSGTQLSIEDPRWGNGAFTKAVVEGLSGQADYTKDGKITVNQLDLYISERVKTLTDNRQTPVTAKPDTLPDFPIGVVR